MKEDDKRYYTEENARAANCVPVARIHPDLNSALGDGTQYIGLDTQPDASSVTQTSVDSRPPFPFFESVNIHNKQLGADAKMYVEGKGVAKDENSTLEMSAEMLSNEQKIAHYEKRLQEEPSNISLRLEFVKFQDRIGNSLSEGGDTQAKLSKFAIHKKKVAIMKKAVKANPGNVDLHLKYLELCRCSLSTFSVGRVCKLYQRCIKTLQKYGDANVHTVDTEGNVQQKLLGMKESSQKN